MVKYIFLLRPVERVDIAALKALIFDQIIPRLLESNPEKLKVDITEPKRPGLTVIPFKKRPLAMISVWDAGADRVEKWRASLTVPNCRVAGYQVSESAPKAYTKDWKDGEPSPGVVMLTLMRKNPDLSYEQFMKEWFEHHTPNIAMKVHPLWNYIRNVVDSVVIEGSPPLDGIVEEHLRERSDITNPARYFGGA
ncbi:MAG: hypothetical protein WC333_04580, partial [Dehalococcoidia bacterium]